MAFYGCSKLDLWTHFKLTIPKFPIHPFPYVYPGLVSATHPISFWGDPEAFPGQMGHTVSPAGSGSATGVFHQLDVPGILPKEDALLPLDVRAPYMISDPVHPMERVTTLQRKSLSISGSCSQVMGKWSVRWTSGFEGGGGEPEDFAVHLHSNPQLWS